MHSIVKARDERGAVAIVMSLVLTLLLVITAMVLDFGLVRIDRQIDRSAADQATLAGLHGLNTGDGVPHPYAGVCTAMRYLKVNSPRFSSLTENVGWRDGLGNTTASGCSDAALRNLACKPTDRSTWAKWTWSGTSRGVTLNVTIESGYDLAPSSWSEDSLPATSGDNGGSTYQGCDNLAVTIAQSRESGLGSLATSSDLETAIRSVGRVKAVPGESAPAMLLLKRTGCPVLKTGASGGGSFIRVLGAMSSDGKTQAGTIHSDSDGVGCNGGNNSWVYGGLSASGIVAYAAPQASNPLAADPAKPGSITSVAVLNGLSGSIVRDSLDYAYGTSALSGTAGTKTEVTGRGLTTRRLVDERYFGSAATSTGVKGAMSLANGVFTAGATSAPPGYTTLVASDVCKPTQSEINAMGMTAATRLYIPCVSNAGFSGDGSTLTIPAGTIYFRGVVSPGSLLKMPAAHHVYVGNHFTTPKPDAIDVSNGRSFEMNTAGNVDAAGNCSSGQNSSKAVLFVRSGTFKHNGLLRMCRTTAMLMGGQSTGCVPTLTGTAPTTTPCGGGLGSGQFTQNGGTVDWTAPDTLDATTDPATGDPTATAVSAWTDPNGLEDLALWSESASNSSTSFSMGGSGSLSVRGVFMVPNADPFIIGGGGSQNLTNAQYVASSIALNGNTTNITMSVDPNAAITLPDQGLVGLVR